MSVTAMQPIALLRVTATLLPIMAVVFVAFLVVGVAMPVLPLHVHDRLGFGTFVVGLVAGSQFAASLITRPWAGHFSDQSAYTAFLDLAQGLASPALGLIATGARLNVLFLAGAATVLCAALVAWWLIAHPFTVEGHPQ